MTGRDHWLQFLLPVLAIVLCLTPKAAAWAAQDDQTFYNQGRADYDARNPEKSRSEAIADMQAEVLRQAVENLVDEERLASKKDEVQSRILKDPKRYVRSFQVISQEVENGKLRVAGQVVVNIDELVRSLSAVGLVEAPPEAAAESDQGTEEAIEQPADNDGEDQAEAADEEAGATNEAEGGAALGEAQQTGGEQVGNAVQDQSQVTQGEPRNNIVVLWWVAEKWEQASPWHVPGVNELGVAVQALFAASMRQEVQAMGWTLVLPEAGVDLPVQEVDGGRTIPVDQAKAEARRRNAEALVIGTATQERRANGKVELVADLTLLDVASGDQLGDLHRDLSLTPLENPSDYAEEIIKLSSWVAPGLNRLVNSGFGEKDRSGRENQEPEEEATGSETGPEVAPAPKSERRSENPAPQGWTLMIEPFHSPTQWEQLEQALRKRIEGLEVVSLEFGTGSAMVELDHAPDNLPAILRELQLQTGRVEVKNEDPLKRTIQLSIVP